jgi:hypothetical protein
MSNKRKPRASKERKWAEPYEWILWFVTAGSDREVTQLRPRLRWACRELKKRTYYLKRHFIQCGSVEYGSSVVVGEEITFPDLPPGDYEPFLWDPKLGVALYRLREAVHANGAIDDDSRRRINDTIKQIFTLKVKDPVSY